MVNNLDKIEKNEIKKILDSVSVPKYFVGYKYIVTAIPILIDAIYCNQPITLNELYLDVSKKHRTTPKKVECAIRYVHENTKIFEICNCVKLSNKSLLYSIADTIMQKLQSE